jgi:hypothetical protein
MKAVNLWQMSKVETIEEFYKRKFDWIPENIKKEIGHFNVFEHEPVEPGKQSQYLINEEISIK